MELDEKMAVTAGLGCAKMPALMPHNEAPYDMLESILSQDNKAIIVSATGTGKSYIAAKYIAEHKANAVIVCPKRSIRKSWGSLVPGVATMTYQHLCWMKQEDILALPYTCWVFDEAHHCCGPKWQKNIDYLMEHAAGCKFIGLTADPVRHSDGGLDVSKEIFDGNVVKGLELHEAISQDVLPSFTYVSTVFGLEKAMGEAKAKAETPGPNRYRVAEKIARLQNNLQNQYRICEILDKHMPEGKRKGVVFVDCIAGLSEAMDIMREWAGNDAQFLTMHSRQPAAETNAVMEKFREMEEGYVFAIDMLNEGLHFPGVNTVIMFRHTESPNVYFQQIGRGLAANGENPVIFDFVGNRKSLSTRSNADRQSLLTGNSADRKSQANVILYDYANEALDLLDEIRDLLDGKWTEEEKNIIRKYYAKEGEACSKRLPGRTPKACQAVAAQLGIQCRTLTPWSAEEDEILKKYYPEEGIAVEKRLPGRNMDMVYAHVRSLGLKSGKFFTAEEDAILRQFYPLEGEDAAARIPGKTKEQCKNRAHALQIHGPSYVAAWTAEEDAILREFYPSEGRSVAKRLEGRSGTACSARARTVLDIRCNSGLKGAPWTDEEISILEGYYPSEGVHVAERLPGRTAQSCKAKASKVGLVLKGSPKTWSDAELRILDQYYPEEGKDVAKRLPGRSPDACAIAAQKRGIVKIKKTEAWTDEELSILDQYYPKEGKAVAGRIPAHSAEACKRKANLRGIQLESQWTDREIAILTEYYPNEGRDVAKRLANRDGRSCYQKARKLGLCEEKVRRWTEEEIAILKQYYPTEGSSVAKRLPGRTGYSCKAKAREFGLLFQPVK